MFLPLNGRIAIIDDEINEVAPLFKIFSKNRIPYIFIKGDDLEYLPDEEDETNDIRIVFLDLNLLGGRTPSNKDVKSSLFSLLKKVISKNNFPYSIILWSKQESQYTNVVSELFENELADRKPITIEKFIKSDFFDLDGNFQEAQKDIVSEINEILKSHQAYSTLIHWENKVHKSADETLQNIFSSYEDETWVDKTNCVITKLGIAYLGNKNYKEANYIERTKGSLQAFNSVFNDTLEYNIYNSSISNQEYLTYNDEKAEISKLSDIINRKLFISEFDLSPDYPGVVSTIEGDSYTPKDKIFEDLLNNTFNRYSVIDDIENLTKDENKRKKEIDKKASIKRKEIRKTWQKIYLVVTPLCDKVQNKNYNIRVVKGFIINKKYEKYIDNKSEAVFISPAFYDDNLESSRIIVLNFRYFFTFTDPSNLKDINPIFRLRNQIIAEIQSKLARHINRQGILFVE